METMNLAIANGLLIQIRIETGGSINVIEQHYRDNYRKLVKRMTFRSGTEWDAEDVVQRAYMYAISYIKSFDGRHFSAWFNTILNNALRDHKNSEKGFTATSFEEDEHDGTPCTHYADRIVAEVEEIIQTKSLAQIEVLTLYFKQGYTAKDISRITDNSYSASRQMILRFRNELKELYG